MVEQADLDAVTDEYPWIPEPTRSRIAEIRGFSDDTVLAIARSVTGLTFRSDELRAYLDQHPDTNPNWATGRCAEEAYRRGLIYEDEFDRLTDAG